MDGAVLLFYSLSAVLVTLSGHAAAPSRLSISTWLERQASRSGEPILRHLALAIRTADMCRRALHLDRPDSMITLLCRAYTARLDGGEGDGETEVDTRQREMEREKQREMERQEEWEREKRKEMLEDRDKWCVVCRLLERVQRATIARRWGLIGENASLRIMRNLMRGPQEAE